MNFIEAARKARAGSNGTPAFTKPALIQARMSPASETEKENRDSPVPKNGGCFSCGHYDGQGTAWPGMCRYFETIGESAKEIDFNVVDVVHGCHCYTLRQNTPELVSNTDRQKLRGDDPDWITPAMYQRQTTRARDKRRISPVALQWLREHRQELKAAGWTAKELYRRNKAEGICWSGIWDKPFFKAYLLEKGVIEFEFVDGGRVVIQTARPMPQRSTTKK
ncbi:MAG: hypothetical protein ABIJ50_03420 [Pseudomonadota bacterium]